MNKNANETRWPALWMRIRPENLQRIVIEHAASDVLQQSIVNRALDEYFARIGKLPPPSLFGTLTPREEDLLAAFLRIDREAGEEPLAKAVITKIEGWARSHPPHSPSADPSVQP